MFEFDIEEPWDSHLHRVVMEIDLTELIDEYDYRDAPSSVDVRFSEYELKTLIAKLQQQLSILKELNKNCKVRAYDYRYYPDFLHAAVAYRDRFDDVPDSMFFDLDDKAEQKMRAAIEALEEWERLNTDKENN